MSIRLLPSSLSYTDDQGTAETPPTSTATAAVTNTNDASVIAITGTVKQGETLTATVTDADGITGTITYQWQAGGVDISGATGQTYVLTQAECR